MIKPRVLILGATGMLGSALCRVLSGSTELYATSRTASLPFRLNGTHVSGIDVSEFADLETKIQQIRPNEIINCVGIIKQRPEGKDPEVCISINGLLPHRLAKTAQKIGARLITFSTDCVFSGKTGGYTDDAPCDAEDIYGKSKFVGELTEAPGLTIRSSIIGPEPNSKLSLFEWFRSHQKAQLTGYRGAIYTGLTTLEMGRLVADIIHKSPDLFGRWNVASDAISKYELLKLINDRLKLENVIQPDDKFHCDRSLNGSRFRKKTGYTAPSWERMVNDLATWTS